MTFNTYYSALLRDSKTRVAPSADEARRDYRNWILLQPMS